jgi:threonine/homoserine/homoserine lactone efflux protein
MKYAPHITMFSLMLFIASTPAAFTILGLLSVAFLLYFIGYPEDAPEIKRIDKREFTIKL